MKTKRRTARILLIVLLPLIFAGVFWAVRNRKAGPGPSWPRVVLVGVDGAGWNVLRPLFRKNALPVFQSLVGEGSCGTLETIAPTKSSIIWTSIATGKTMVKHGIVDWTYLDEHDIEVPFSQSERRVKAFWNILTERERPVGVVNWFLTFPPEKVDGFMIAPAFSGLTRANFNKVVAVFPPELQPALRPLRFFDTSNIFEEQGVPDYRRRPLRGAGGDTLGLIPFFPRFFFQEEAAKRVSFYALDKLRVETLATYFRLIDIVSHFAAEFIDASLIARAEAEEAAGGLSAATEAALDAAFSEVVEPVYRYEDRILGELMRLAPPETVFIVCSDHSFYYNRKAYNHHEEPRLAHGVLFLKGAPIKKGHEVRNARVYDILPTMLYLLGLPVAEDMDGRVLTEVIEERYLRKHPVRTIASYEGDAPVSTAPRDRTFDKKILEELRSLGYIK
ncbi:MAG: alkaline phosphatase family protein [Candidatus Aminicenantes bacterium]|nr:alkaline phosphatase family protein [Candidatus Aminicenantes bacterium]